MNMPAMIKKLRPGEKWSLYGVDYAALVWLDSTPKPTLGELQSVELAVAKETRVAGIKLEAMTRILAAYPDWRQRNCALGFYNATTTQAIKDGVNSIRNASNSAEAAVTALASVAAVEAFTW